MSWSSIVMRVADIIESDSDLPVTKCYRYPPNAIDNGILPCVVLLPQADNSMTWIGGNRHSVNYILQARIYISRFNTELTPTGQFDVLTYLDLFRVAFLSRPQLQLNDTALTGVAGNILFSTVQGLNRPVDYPPNSRLSLFWGCIVQLTIPFVSVIPMKITGN